MVIYVHIFKLNNAYILYINTEYSDVALEHYGGQKKWNCYKPANQN